jgi:hypothetical protein
MYTVLLLLYTIQYVHSQQQQQTTTQVWFINQTNVNAVYTGQILCQQLLDHAGQPLLLVADDFTLPQYPTACDAMTLQLDLTVQYLNVWPNTLILWFMRDNATSAGPGERFFSTSVPYNVNGPDVYTLDSQLVDTNDATLRFDLTNETLFPRDTIMWLAVYAPLILSQNNKGQNALFWHTAYTGFGGHFFYRDVNNLQLWNFTDWTDASVASQRLALPTGSLQMAWNAALRCVATPVPTPVPTEAITKAPVSVPNRTDTVSGSKFNVVALGVALPLAVIVTIILVGVIVVWLRRGGGRLQYQQNQSSATQAIDIRQKLMQLPNQASSTSSPTQQTPQHNPLYTMNLDEPIRGSKSPQPGPRYVFTSGREMVNVPLGDKNSPFATLLDNSEGTMTSDEEVFIVY